MGNHLGLLTLTMVVQSPLSVQYPEDDMEAESSAMECAMFSLKPSLMTINISLKLLFTI